jgi:hypothetical protein
MALATAQIGKCGELLVQLELLRRGIESAPMSTDSGVDLVVYSPKRKVATTVQVKSNFQPKPGGGKGKPALDWWISEENPADLIALVDLSTDRIWLFRKDELSQFAQQKSGGRYHHMYTDPTARPKKTERSAHVYEFERFSLQNRSHELFGL